MPQIAFVAGTASMYGQEFKFSDMPNSAEFSALFDQYRITGISIKFIPCQTGSDVNPNSTSIFLPNLMSVIDYTDSAVPSGINELMQYQNCKRTKITRTHSRYFKPRVLHDVVGQGATTGYTPKPWPFVSFGIDVTGYGIKWGLDQIFNVSSGGFGVDRYVTYYFECKNVR